MKPLLGVAFILLSSISFADEPESWIDSPEAYFATKAERAEWERLPDRAQREAFKARYWKRRDPSPGTEKNEFREVILDRIKKADAKYPIADKPGSLTARGFAYVVFGPPARVRGAVVEPLERPRTGDLPTSSLGNREGTERNEIWIYDTERTPNLLKMLNRPALEITIVVEPNKHKDSIQNPGLANQYRDMLAARSIVTEFEVPMSAAEPEPAPEPLAFDSLSATPLPDSVIATFAAEAIDSEAKIDALVFWREAGSSELVVTAFAPAARKRDELTLYARIRDAGGEIVGSASKRAEPSPDLFASQPGTPMQLRFALPPGSYDAEIALAAGSSRPLAVARRRIEIPSLDSFAVSSIILTGGIDAGSGPRRLVSLGPLHARPRADATFLASESLWYLVEVANPNDAGDVTIEMRLRRRGQPIGTTGVVPASLERIGEGRYVAARELPLLGYDAGDYTLYLIVRDGEREEVRRAEFRLIER